MSKRIKILDGGMATSLEEKGFDLTGNLWSAKILLDNPEAIRTVHYEHASAGADIITTASYQASRSGFRKSGYSESDYLRALEMSVILAQSVADQVESRQERAIEVAASVGPYGAILADGSEYRGDYDVSEEFLIDFHGNRLRDIEQLEPNLLAFETIPSISELRAINHLLNKDFRHLPAWVSMSARNEEQISDGTMFHDALDAITAPNVTARGVNCTRPQFISKLLEAGAGPFVLYPNAGQTWNADTREWEDTGVTTLDESMMEEWVEQGATIIGGCCGLGIDHIESLRYQFG
jgi:homocysteine S-methyltransferase